MAREMYLGDDMTWKTLMNDKTESAIQKAGGTWNLRDTLWWTSRGREDAQQNKPPLFRITMRGIRCAGETPDDWTSEHEEAAARVYVDAYNEEIVR